MQNFYVKDIIEATGGRLLCGNADTPVNMISTNSKEIGEGCLFVPVIGERVDAHIICSAPLRNMFTCPT